MTPVRKWSGREAGALRAAMRLSIRDFAGHLGVNPRTVSKWESGEADLCPRPDTQAILDTALERATEDVRARFEAAVYGGQPQPRQDRNQFTVESHKFVPAYIGVDAARRLSATAAFSRYPHDWLDCRVAQLDHDDGECTLYVFACGVAVAHLRQRRELPDLTTLATWRYQSYNDDLPWLARRLDGLLGDPVGTAGSPEYVLSLYWLEQPAWSDAELDTALRLMAVPSVLVDRTLPRQPRPVDMAIERHLFANGFAHPDVVPFGVQGVSIGYAGWSGVAYYAASPQRALSVRELVDCELAAQMLWCYCHHILGEIEEGREPSVADAYGWRFLRGAYSRLTAARAQETSQHCLMREAILQTSGLPARLKAAQDALRDGERASGGVAR